MKTRLFVALGALLLPTVASAEVNPITENRVVINGGFGAGGSVEIEVSDTGVAPITSSENALASGILGLQYELAIANYFVLAGRFGFTRYDWSDNSSNHRNWLDFDVVPMLTFAIDAGPVIVEPRVSLPIGIGMHMWNADDDLLNFDGINRTNFAWNVGGLGGALVRLDSGSDFVRRLGFILEMGYVHHQAMATGTSDWRYKLSHDQFVVQLGVALSLP